MLLLDFCQNEAVLDEDSERASHVEYQARDDISSVHERYLLQQGTVAEILPNGHCFVKIGRILNNGNREATGAQQHNASHRDICIVENLI
jgi:hypothetical protein